MRKSIVCILVFFISFTAFSQLDTTKRLVTKQDYLRISKSQKTSGFIFLGLGATMIAIAAPGNVSFDVLPVLAIGGSASILASVPLFLAAGRNKRKAMRLSAHLGWSSYPRPTYTKSNGQPLPALSVKIGL